MYDSGDFEFLKLGANLATLAIGAVSALTYYVCWRWSEAARVRRMAERGRAGFSSLPSPVPVLPRWLGLIGGHTLQMKMTKLHHQIEGWADEFGGDFELTITGRRLTYITGAEDIRRILLSRPTTFRRGWAPGQLPSMGGRIGLVPSLFFNEGREWGRSRRILSPGLNGHNNVANMIPAITKIAERVCSKLGKLEGEVVDFVPTFDNYAHDVIALAGFGFDADSVRATHDRPCWSFEAMEDIAIAFMKLMVDPLAMFGWATVPTLVPWIRATKRSTSQLHQVVVGAIDAMRRQIKEAGDSRQGDGGVLLRSLLTKHGSGVRGVDSRTVFSDAEIVTEVKSLFLAGSETTAKSLSWAVYFLAKHPEMHARCREEALRAAPPGSGGMVSTVEQASKLVFCAAVFKEVLRLRPVVPALMLHNSEPVTMKSGTEFEAGTAFVVLLSHPCRSEDSFTRATDYVPERWIEAEREAALPGADDGHGGGKIAHREEDALFFGGGPRKCPGMSMANLEAAIILAAICARFDLALAPGQPDPPESVMTFTVGLESLRLVVTSRPA